MSALNGFVTRTGTYLFTDAAVVDPATLKPAAFISKVAHLPHVNAAIASTGNALVTAMFASALGERLLSSFDDIVDHGEATLRRCMRNAAQFGNPNLFDDCRIAIAGYSPSEGAHVLYVIQERAGMGIDAMTMTSCAMFLNPGCTDESDRSLIDLKFDPNRSDHSGLAIMRAQRRVKTAGGAHVVGGWCQMTTVTQGGIITRALERWPDEIGKSMSPALGDLSSGPEPAFTFFR